MYTKANCHYTQTHLISVLPVLQRRTVWKDNFAWNQFWQFYCIKSKYVSAILTVFESRKWPKLISRKIWSAEFFLNFHTVVFQRKKRIKLENMPICNYTVAQGFPMTENDLDFDEAAPLIQQHLTLLPWHHSSFSQVIIPIISGNHSSMFLLR